MGDRDETRRCLNCQKDTQHIVSGSGAIARCLECDYAFEYHHFYSCAYDDDALIDYDEFGSKTVASKPTCSNCNTPIEPNETYATSDIDEVNLCVECFNNYSLGAPIPFKKTKLMSAVATAMASTTKGEDE